VSAVARLRLRVTARAESILRSGHPWLFADSIREQNREGDIGELAVVYDRRDRFLGVGLYDPTSPIRVRMLHVGKPQTIDREWWFARLEQALPRRRDLFDAHEKYPGAMPKHGAVVGTPRPTNSGEVGHGVPTAPTSAPEAIEDVDGQTTGFRWLNGESDGWPGLVLDRYDTTLVLKLYTAAWLPRLSEVIEMIHQSLNPERVVLRLSRNIESTAAERFNRNDGEIVYGSPVREPIIFLESGLRFEADVLKGQKTGFFLDQRENRRKVRSLAAGRTVLNAFSFTGGFSVYAADGGATSVTDLDISSHALAGAKRNFALNQTRPVTSACEHETIKADALGWLGGNSNRNFNLIVLDPPSFAKRENEKSRAIAAYTRLASLGIRHLRPGGILVACSCSAHVNAGEFFETVRKAAKESKRKFRELETTGHAADHPATFAEAEYLKAIYLAF
jgi:23S rRNA (cytosine1962-C5)-methyltransferase